ncbi:MAG TPA: methyltransferase domain-containing protein [Thermoanaerobaculia bacterium]|jgi:MoaA/NifB/PqqE/SkfB family radical SAM enzyme/SAM-dependent methyltransferase|nr:methyltransferase domain-containing protein [Thermoanaerobaculia bacterium]
MITLTERSALHVPELHLFEADHITYAVDAAAPNWIAIDERGSELIRSIGAAQGSVTSGALVSSYASRHGLEAGKAWLHVHDFLSALGRASMLFDQPVVREPYAGRAAYVEPKGLRELWLQINNACNLTCTHCLVSSGPNGIPGMPTGDIFAIIDAAAALGIERVYITGGEPFLRKDIFDLTKYITETHGCELIVLTNATLFAGRVRQQLDSLSRQKVKFQVSIDGARPETNDPIRGAGTFVKALEGARVLAGHGFDVSLTTVTTEDNLEELPKIPAIVKRVGARSQHLMWSHKRGRALESNNGFFPENAALLAAVVTTINAAHAEGVTLDNLEAVKRRVNGVPGIKYDLGNAGWDSICVYADGTVYPSAALANEQALLCGDLKRKALADIIAMSPVIRRLRETTLARNAAVSSDPFRFLTGGGDIEHAWCFSGDFLGVDPYYPISVELTKRVMRELGEEKLARRNTRSGYDAPMVLHAMGEGAIACGTADGTLAEQPVLTLHSNCVLSFDVDKPRAKVREFYGAAAQAPVAELCCPTKYDDSAISHIPRDVLDRFYGCGSPMTAAGIKEGEVVVDLGSGAGIDVFIAAKFVGATGKAIGVDMTDRMLHVARENQPRVAAALGYDVVEFREGFLEQIPVDSKSVDLVTSNCVVNLSPDKPRVFAETWRVLKDHGRILISDIVSEKPVPPRLKVNPQLWGECLVGALTQEEFLSELERAGFYGLEVLKKTYWKDVEGYPFFSITVRGYKFEKTSACVFKGHRAVYLGPAKAFLDEEGHQFPRNEPYEICTDTVAKLSNPPYKGMFAILEPGEERAGYACCGPQGCC